MSRLPYVILGAGGYGRVVAETLRASGMEVAAFLDPNRALWDTTVDGVRVAGGDERIRDFPPERFTFAVGVGSVGDSSARRRTLDLLRKNGRAVPPLVASSAAVASSARLADGAQVLARAVINPGASLAAGVVVCAGAIVDHDCVLGAHAFIAPGAIVCAGVRIGEDAFVEAGAVILPGAELPAKTRVSAGGVFPAAGR